MTDINQKQLIMESLNSLDQAQADKVLAYIKDLLSPLNNEAAYQNFKSEALKEIRKALRKKRNLKAAF